jgi:hypothetical protein
MLDWRPIEEYDALKRKPKLCLFRFESSINKRGDLSLDEMFDVWRCRGFQQGYKFTGRRVCTHYAKFKPPTDTKEDK